MVQRLESTYLQKLHKTLPNIATISCYDSIHYMIFPSAKLPVGWLSDWVLENGNGYDDKLRAESHAQKELENKHKSLT